MSADNDNLLRAAFETWITSPPFEKSVSRFPAKPSAAWWGAYRDYAVHLAWDAWQESARITAALEDEAGGWIPVSERFPETGKTVWVSNGVMACECHRFWNSRTREEDWAHPFDNSDSPLWWRELPPPPKGE